MHPVSRLEPDYVRQSGQTEWLHPYAGTGQNRIPYTLRESCAPRVARHWKEVTQETASESSRPLPQVKEEHEKPSLSMSYIYVGEHTSNSSFIRPTLEGPGVEVDCESLFWSSRVRALKGPSS